MSTEIEEMRDYILNRYRDRFMPADFYQDLWAETYGGFLLNNHRRMDEPDTGPVYANVVQGEVVADSGELEAPHADS